MRIGIVLSGGGSHGDFEVGALSALYNRGIRPDVVAGTSVGAINAVAIAQGEGGLSQLRSIWFSLQYNSHMWKEDISLSGVSDQLKTYLELSGGHLFADLTLGMGPALPFWPIGDAVLYGIPILELYDLYNKVKAAKSLYNLDPIRAQLTNVLDANKVMNSGIKLRLAMVSLESGKLRFVNEQAKFIDDNTQVNLVDAVMASASIPFIFPPVKLGTENFIDGGVRDVLPVDAALDAGADLIYAICCGKAGVDPDTSYDSKNLLDIGIRAAEGIMPDQIQLSNTNPPRGWGADVRVIQPEFDVHDSMTIDPGLIRITYGYGYMRAADIVDAYPGNDPLLVLRFLALSTLARQITEKRRAIWDEEFDANGEERLTAIVRHSHTALVPDPVALRTVRALKLELKALIEQRQIDFGLGPRATVQSPELDFGQVPVPMSISLSLQVRNSGDGGMPAGASNLWTQWEAHNWEPLTDTPWDFFNSKLGSVPAVTPPLSTVSLADLFLTSLSSSNPAFTISTSATSLAPGQSATVTVAFKATAGGVQHGTLQIGTNDAANPLLNIALTAEAIVLPPTIVVSPGDVSFGLAKLHDIVKRTIMITNRGSSALTIQTLQFAPQTPFSAPGQTLPFSIPPLGIHALQLQFAPTAVRPYIENLTIKSDDPDPKRTQIPVLLRGVGEIF
jgi:predicted acylesterase/phospholipase RssA